MKLLISEIVTNTSISIPKKTSLLNFRKSSDEKPGFFIWPYTHLLELGGNSGVTWWTGNKPNRELKY